jgi:uncharacterized protein DUF3999
MKEPMIYCNQKRLMAVMLAAVIFPLGAIPLCAAADDNRYSCYTSAAAITLNGSDSVQRIALPLSILRASQRRELTDVRILNAAQQPVPFAWLDNASQLPMAAAELITAPQFIWPEAAGNTSEHSNLKVEVQADGAVVNIVRGGAVSAAALDTQTPRWLLDLSSLKKRRADELIVYWKNSGGLVSQATVEASSDAQNWQRLAAGTLVNVPDANGEAAIEQRRIKLPAFDQSLRYLRIAFTDALALDHVHVKIAASEQPIALESANFTALASDNSSWTLDLGGALNVRRMQIQLAQNNVVLPLEIAQRPAYTKTQPAGQWITVGRAIAYRLQREGREAASPAFDIEAPAAREWLFRLNGAVSEKTNLDVTVSWIAPQMIFAAQGQPPFTVVAGCKDATAVSLERRALIPDYRERDEWKLAQAVVDPAAIAVPVQPISEQLKHASAADKRRWILWAVLIGVTAALALLARKLFRELHANK